MKLLALGLAWLGAAGPLAATPAPQLDPRDALDVLVVVAHSDDETVMSPWLARAVFDQRQRIGVAYVGSGSGGFNPISRERAHGLGIVRRFESERGLAALGIRRLWFLGERLDASSSNPLTALANLGHGATLEKLVRLVRATRPKVIVSWLPAQTIGENHGDHQAAGALAAEAFDLAPDRTAFPAQLSAAGAGTDGLAPWAPRKLYFATDAFHDEFLTGTGPAYSSRERSPAKGRSYVALAAAALAEYPTQFKADLEELFGVSLDALTAALGTPREDEVLRRLAEGDAPFWFEPLRFLRARTRVGGVRTEDVLAGLERPLLPDESSAAAEEPAFALGGPWAFSRRLRARHALEPFGTLGDEIAVHPGRARVEVPLAYANRGATPAAVRFTLETPPPAGWALVASAEREIAAGDEAEVVLALTTPSRRTPVWDAVFVAEVEGRVVGRAALRLQVTDWTLPQ